MSKYATDDERREAARVRASVWYYANKERARANSKRWHDAHKEEAREYAERYRAENLEELREYDRKRSATPGRKAAHAEWRNKPENAAKVQARVRKWAKSNPEKAKANTVLSNARRRARERNAFIEDVDRDEIIRASDGICGLCGQSLKPEEVELDHIYPLSRGGVHSYRNLHATHVTCNRKKGASMPGRLYSA